MKPSRASLLAILIVGITAAAILYVAGGRILKPGPTHVDVDRLAYPAIGIDISAHNGEIDFDKVAAQGVSFVYMKATEGATWVDSRFDANHAAARAAGLKIGAYHFFRFDVPGWRQSVNLIRALKHHPIDLPVAIDVEEWGNPANATTEEIVASLRSMIELLRQNGREPVIYTNKNGYYRFVRGRFDDVGLWICSFTTPPIPETERWLLWQHSHKGHIDGIPSAVSLDTYNSPEHGPISDWLDSHPTIPAL